MRPEETDTIACPPSESCIAANLASCAIFFGLVFYLGGGPARIVSTGAILAALAAAMLPMMITDLLRQRKRGAYAKRRSLDLPLLGIKLLGLYATFGLLLGVYWAVPEYRGSFYDRFYGLLHAALPWLAGLAIPYFAWMDTRSSHPHDGYYHFGLLALGRWRRADLRMAREHVKSWAVKGFFLPLMSTYLLQNVAQLSMFDFHFPDFMSFYRAAYHFTFSVDLLFACTGYLMTLRLFNTPIYSAEPTALGWAVCLMCYQPFWGAFVSPLYLNYEDGYYWDDLTSGSPTLLAAWGAAILICLAIYAWATVAFGYRFSNLTYRGLIANGPYRFTKHPAYVFKCASWWLISVPFIASQGAPEALRQCLMLSGLCFVYYMRARTEESHLSNYPEYVAYAEWMNRRGLFAPLGRLLPFLAYSRERARASGSRVYAPYAEREVT